MPGMKNYVKRRLTSPRIAQTIADELRRQIVDGELADGDLLPPQSVLVERFNVSLVSLREALRILETEGLVSVRRGNQGGAVVHAPDETTAAAMLGLLLQSKNVPLSDLAQALTEFEPACAGLAAQRVDRADTVVPELHRINSQMAERLDDGSAFTECGRRFHDMVVRGCGNRTMIAMVGCLEALWTTRELQWAEESTATGDYPSMSQRKAVLKAHEALTDAIAIGDPQRARRVAARHVANTQSNVLAGELADRIIAPAPDAVIRIRERRIL